MTSFGPTDLIILLAIGVVLYFIGRLLVRSRHTRGIRAESPKREPIENPKSAVRQQAAPPQSGPKSGSSAQQPRAPDKVHVFVSYRRTDSADVTGRIYDRLTAHFGRESVFKDVDSIPLGVDFRKHLDEMVGGCDILVAVIGDQWLTASDSEGKLRLEDPRDFVRIEIESALERAIPVIPVLVRGASFPPQNRLPMSLSPLVFRNGIQVRPDPDFHRDMDRLIASLDEHFGRKG